MKTVTVQFTNVGAGKKSWTCELPHPLTFHSLFNAVKRQQALGSRDIEFAENGGIYVGFVRRVGDWRVLQAAEPVEASHG